MSVILKGFCTTNSDGTIILPEGEFNARITNAIDEGGAISFDVTIPTGPEYGISSHTFFVRRLTGPRRSHDELNGRLCLLTIKHRVLENGDRYEELENFKILDLEKEA